MGTNILIIGETGSGKSTSFRNLDQEKTFIINVDNKPLPFGGWELRKPGMEGVKKEDVNCFATRKPSEIIDAIRRINEGRKDITRLIIDDLQYVTAFAFLDRAMEKNYDKFNEVAKDLVDIISAANNCRDDLKVIFLAHSEKTEDGLIRMQTAGKIMREKVTVEGRFTIVLHAFCKDDDYMFATKSMGLSTAKSPMGLLEEKYVPNDLNKVIEEIDNYYSNRRKL